MKACVAKKVSELSLSGLFEGYNDSLVLFGYRLESDEGRMYVAVELARLCATDEDVVDGNVNCERSLLAPLLLCFCYIRI